MKIALIGSGGREDALAQTLAKSACVEKIWVLPGNEGMRSQNKIELIDIDINEKNIVILAIETLSPDLVVIGPEKTAGAGTY
jgi:phosphoribosylamine--glycine ligase